MEDFPANSAKARARYEGPGADPRTEKVERITTAEAKRRERGLGRKFKDTFFGGDARGTVEYMATDVVVPAIRDMMYEAFHAGLERLIYGESRFRRGSGPPRTTYPDVGRVNYNSYSNPSSHMPPPSSRTISRQSRARHSFDDIVITSRPEAEEVLQRMYDILNRYGMVTVSELYEMTGIASSHTDHKWGWISLPGAKVIPLRNRNGYVLNLPDPEPLG